MHQILQHHLQLLYKNSIQNETFSGKKKIARITPILKEIPYARTTSLLNINICITSIVKILSNEKWVLKQIFDFIENHKLYKPTQSGFTRKHSMSTLLVQFSDEIINALRKGELIIATFAYFPKHSTPLTIVYQLRSFTLWIF